MVTDQPPSSVLLLDIEGTATPIDFVYEILFPYARTHLETFLRRHLESVRAEIAQLVQENAKDRLQGLAPPVLSGFSHESQLESVVAYAHWLMDRDRKSTPLKSLQGRIWEEGYQSGELHSQLFADVPPALQRWQRQGKDVCIFSSGSVLAQKLLFSHTEAGDLTRFIKRYFDTNIGAKTESGSYHQIAAELGRSPAEILFVSDVVAELDAARSAGLHTVLCVRPGNRPQPVTPHHPTIVTFDELFPE